MHLRLLLAFLHLAALGIGLGAVWARARALDAAAAPGADAAPLRRAFAADTWWGVAALLWIATGLARLFLGTEKVPAFYYHNHIFWTKMALLGLILALEIRPMLALIRWRRLAGQGAPVDPAPARSFARISRVQAFLVLAMVLSAAAMARGLGS